MLQISNIYERQQCVETVLTKKLRADKIRCMLEWSVCSLVIHLKNQTLKHAKLNVNRCSVQV